MGFKLVQMIAHTLLKGEIIQNYLKYVGTFKYLLKNVTCMKASQCIVDSVLFKP